MDKGYKRPTARARELRNHATSAERRLWTALSGRKIAGVRFNRQFPVGSYICDFVSRSARLVVEVDGDSHDLTITRDEVRTRYLESQGYKVLRLRNADILENLDGVALEIERELANRPSPGPSRKREGSMWGSTIRWYSKA